MTLKDIKPNPRNPRSITESDLDALGESLDEYGDLSGFVFNRDGTIISAHQRWKNIKGKVRDFVVSETFETPLPDGTIQRGHFELKDGRKYDYAVRDWPKEKADAATIRANRQNAGTWDAGILGEWDLTPAELIEFGVPEFVFGEGGGGLEVEEESGGTPVGSEAARKPLAERFIIPPFSVFDTRQGYWQTRKRQWLALGIKSELGRGGAVSYDSQDKLTAIMKDKSGGGQTLGAIPPNERQIMKRQGKYATSPGGGQNVKMAMHNDPKQRKAKYDGKKG